MANQSIMIVSQHLPGQQGVGEQWLDSIIEYLPSRNLSYFYYGKQVAQLPEAILSIPHYISRNMHETGYIRLGRHIASGTRLAIEKYVDLRFLSRIIQNLSNFVKQENPDTIFITLHSPTSYKLLACLADKIDIPIKGIIWDPFDYVLRCHYSIQTNSVTYHYIFRYYTKGMNKLSGLGVMSENMCEDIYRHHKVDSTIIHYPIQPELWSAPKSYSRDIIRIGFAGSIYASKEWQLLMQSLDTMNWTLDGRSIEVWLFTNNIVMETNRPRHLIYFGWRSLAETIAVLSEVDLLYLPYQFESSFAEAARQSFPTKLSTYLAAGRPVLFHGPEDSSVSQFMKKYKIGIGCHSLEVRDMLSSINNTLKFDDKIYEAERMRALQNEFHPNIFHSQLTKIFSVEYHNTITDREQYSV